MLLDLELLHKIVPAGMGSPLELLMESSTEATSMGILLFLIAQSTDYWKILIV